LTLFKKEEKSADAFWKEFEEKTGEKVLARGLGKYVSGWEEFAEKKLDGKLWGLLITTSGGFHFKNFAQNNLIDSLFRSALQNEPPQDKIIFIPQEKISSFELKKESKWWKKLLRSSSPQLVIMYKNDNGGEDKRLVFEAEYADNSSISI